MDKYSAISKKDVILIRFAQMAELVDALVSGTSFRKRVQVRVLFWAQKKEVNFTSFLYMCFCLSIVCELCNVCEEAREIYDY